MTLTTDQRNEFACRFYEWSLSRWKIERDSDYQCLSAFKYGLVPHYRDLLKQTTRTEHSAITTAMVKCFHQEGARLCGTPLTENEFLLRTSVRDEALRRLHREGWTSKGAGDSGFRQNRAQFRRSANRSVADALHVTPVKLPGGEIRYSIECNGWQIETYLDTYSRYRVLEYHHRIHRASDIDSVTDENTLLERTSALHWLGLDQCTEWDARSKDDAPAIICAVTSLCELFVSAAHSMLSRLVN